MGWTIYLVEDDLTLASAIRIGLAAEGFRVHTYPGIEAARTALAIERPDLVILDLSLPDGDGLDLVRALRRARDVLPILILTARGTAESRIEGLRRGADDYLVKPFELEELSLRARALLRRSGPCDAARVLGIGRLEVDFGARTARRGTRPIELTEIEWRLLRYLADRPNQPISREALLETIWGMGPGTRSRTVDTFAGRLRKWIEPDPAHPRVLLTIRGVGYRLVLGPSPQA